MSCWLCFCVLLLCTVCVAQDDRLHFTLNGRVIHNHSLVRMENIGEGPRGLVCVTPQRPCCREQRLGEWYFPDGSLVSYQGIGDDFYRNRSDSGGVVLNRRRGALGPNGRFTCRIPHGNGGNLVELVAGIYSDLAFPTVLLQPSSVMNAVPGSRVTFSVSSSDAVIFRWVFKGDLYLHNSAKHSGVNSPTLVIEDVREQDEGDYHCVVEKELSVSSDVATLTVMDPPVVTQHPVNVFDLVPGQDVTLSITATGPSLSYSWSLENDPLPGDPRYVGGNTHMLTIAGVMVEDEGTYRCVVSNEAGTVASDPAEIKLLEPPIIEVQPENQLELNIGQEVSFSLLASGKDLSYQWHFSGGSIETSDYSGANTSSLTLAGVMAHHAGSYYCEVSNRAGTVASLAANLTVNASPVASLNVTQGVTSAHLTWSPSISDSSLSYHIEYHHTSFPNVRTVADTMEPSYLAVGLIPRGTYVFEVQQVTRLGAGSIARLDVRLVEDIPAVEDLAVELLNSTSLWVSWQPLMSLPGWNTSRYQVHYTLSTSTAEQQQTRVVETAESAVVLVPGMYSGEVFIGSVGVVVEVGGVLEVDVEGLGVLTGERARISKNFTIDKEEAYFQIVLGPMDFCISWTDEKTSAVRSDIRSSLAGLLSSQCYCNYSLANIADGVFSCRQSSNTVTYRSSISGPRSEEDVAHISQWIQSDNATMIIRTFIVDVLNPPNCPISISSLSEPECPNDQGLTPRTLVTSDPAVINCVEKCLVVDGEDSRWPGSSCTP